MTNKENKSKRKEAAIKMADVEYKISTWDKWDKNKEQYKTATSVSLLATTTVGN